MTFFSRAETTGHCREVAIVAPIIGGLTVFEGQRSVDLHLFKGKYLLNYFNT